MNGVTSQCQSVRNNTNVVNHASFQTNQPSSLLSFDFDQSKIRKGKWTIEEENYANKVIECFNNGTLRLGPSDKSITLRSYLAYLLSCDPMRITKKYAGDSCLGKRVYKPDQLTNDNIRMVERDHQELEALEDLFYLKLSQGKKSKRKYQQRSVSSTFRTRYNSDEQDENADDDVNSDILGSTNQRALLSSTPALDALIMQRRAQSSQQGSLLDFPSPLVQLDPSTPLLDQQATHERYLVQLKREARMVLLHHDQSTQRSAERFLSFDSPNSDTPHSSSSAANDAFSSSRSARLPAKFPSSMFMDAYSSDSNGESCSFVDKSSFLHEQRQQFVSRPTVAPSSLNTPIALTTSLLSDELQRGPSKTAALSPATTPTTTHCAAEDADVRDKEHAEGRSSLSGGEGAVKEVL